MLKWCCYKLTFKQLFSVVHNQEASKFTPYQVCFYSILTDWNFLNIWKSESKTENRYYLGRRSSLHTENLISSSKKCIEKKRKRERERGREGEGERDTYIYILYIYIYIHIHIYNIYVTWALCPLSPYRALPCTHWGAYSTHRHPAVFYHLCFVLAV